MDRSQIFLSFLLLIVSSSHAALPAAEVYWQKVLSNTPMPGAIKDLLTPDVYIDEKSGTSVNVGKGGVNVNTGKGKPGGTTVNVGKGGVNVNTGKGKPGGTSVNVGHGGVGVNAGGGSHGNTRVGVGHGGVGVNVGGKGNTHVGVSPGGVGVNVGPKGKPPVVVNVKPYYSPFMYKYAATETQIHDDPNTALFFLEKDLHSGTKMNLHFTKTTSGATFLPHREANSIPFSSAKLPEILTYFSINPNTIEAETIKETIQECEDPAVAGETKYCATSLESMIEFSTSSLGTRNVRAVSTAVAKEGSPKQQYTLASSSGAKRMAGSKLVVCHAKPYTYAVFYCHTTRATKAYTVPMVGKDGTEVEAVAVCHTDTAGWNPKHIAFRVLGVKPGTVPICHFLPQDHVVWSPNK